MVRRSWVGLVILLAACDPGDVVLLAPEVGGAGAPEVSVRVLVDTPYAALATSLGWLMGVPGAEVRVHRMDEPYSELCWASATADRTGLATFADLLAGLYEVEVTRPLTPEETAQTHGRNRVLAGGMRASLPVREELEVAVEPDHRGALVFSEFETSVGYFDAKYFEVYNNSDTTIFLDGKYWGIAWDAVYDYPYWPCAQTESVRNDPDGIWTQRVFRFPGGGADYPLRPSEAVVVAKAAVDHRAVDPGLYDLRHADFEWGGFSSADNPDVPNLEDIGLRPMVVNQPFAVQPVFLAEPVGLQTLQRYVDPHSGDTWVRIPGALILDASAGVFDVSGWVIEARAACRVVLHQHFERLPGPGEDEPGDFGAAHSSQRRILTVLPDGRKVLQDANTSMVDFVEAPRTPGWIPDSLP